MRIALFGATGKTGRYVVARLCERGHAVRAIGRSAERLAAIDERAERVVADLARPETLGPAVAGAECLASLAHARHIPAILFAAPAATRLVLTGSLRRFSKLPDPAADAVRAGEAAFIASGRPGVMLHPSMIYGAPDDRNVNRLLRLLRCWPTWLPAIVPLPDGGRRLVQPVFVDDVVDAFVAAIERPESDGPPIVVAGPEAIEYRALVAACARAVGRRAIVAPLPTPILAGLARLAGAVGLRLPFGADELTRAGEDKSFDVSDLERRLGVRPRPFAAGLALKLERGWG